MGQTAEQLIYRKFENGVWGNPVTLYNNPYVQSGDAFVAASIRDIKIKQDQLGTLHIVWNSFVPGACTNENNKEIYHLSLTGDVATGPVRVTQNNTITELSDFAVDSLGNIHLIWTEGAPMGADCRRAGNRPIWYAKTSQGNFTVPELVKDIRAGSSPKIALTSDNAVHMVYFDPANLWVSHKAKINNIWGAEQAFNVGPFSLDNASLISGKDDSLHYVYEHNSAERRKIMYVKYKNGWFAREEISQIVAGHSALRPTVSFDARDIPHVSYIDEENGPGSALTRTMLWTRKDINTGEWQTPQSISLPSQKLVENSHVFTSVTNTLGAVYLAPFAQANYLYVNSAQYTPLILPPPVQNLQLNSDPGSIRVAWSYTSPVPFSHFELYRTMSATSSIRGLQPITTVSSSADHFTDTNVRAVDQYYYALVAVDQAGRKNHQVQFAGPIAAFSPTTNILTDGDMELPDTNNWRAWGRTSNFQKTSSSYNGLQAMHLRSVGTHYGFQQINTAVQAGKKYRYSFRYKIFSGVMETDLGIRDSNRDFENKRGVLNRINNDWQLYAREFTVPPNFVQDFRTIVRIRNGEGLVDDMRIEEVLDPALNIVMDGNMELDGLGPWRNYGRSDVVEKVASTSHSGNKSLHVVVRGNYGAQQTQLQVEAGHTYRLRLYYKIIGTFMPRLGVNNSNQDFEYPLGSLAEPYLATTPVGEWREYTRQFTVPQNFQGDFRLVLATSNNEFIPFVSSRNLPFGELFVDDITIEEVH